MFFNTGIPTFLWVLSNKKTQERKGKVQLIDGSSKFMNLHKNLGQKGKEITEDNRKEIIKLYIDFKENQYSKIFDNTFFGYKLIELKKYKKNNAKQLIFENKKPVIESKWEERIPLDKNIEDYLREEVDPFISDYEFDSKSILTGYQVDFIRYFYQFEKIENLQSLENEIKKTISEINELGS